MAPVGASAERRRAYFDGFEFPYGFYGPGEYRQWMIKAGLTTTRIELIPKDMTHESREGLAGWFRTTWHPYVQRIPEPLRAEFVAEVLDEYLRAFPIDAANRTHVHMVRLEVEGQK